MRLFISLFFFCTSAFAGQDFVIDSLPFPEFLRLCYTQVLKKNVVFSDSVIHDSHVVSLHTKDLSDKVVQSTVAHLLAEYGYKADIFDGVVFVSDLPKTKNPDLVPFFYKPKYRDVSYISDMVSPLFDIGAFTFERKAKPQGDKPRDIVDTGTSAYSLQGKPSDSFIFNGTKLEVDKLSQLLDVVDTPQKQIFVSANIYEVSNGEGQSQSLSLAFSLIKNKLGLDLTSSVAGPFLRFKALGLDAVFGALSGDSRFKVVSSPSLRVKDRETASFRVGSSVPVLGSVTTQNNVATQSVDYKDSGVFFSITPKVFNDVVELKINQELSNFITTTTGVNNSPTLIKRALDTTINAESGEVIILGGLAESKESSSSSGFSFLPSILRNKSKDSTHSDILLVLQFQVI